MTRSSICSVMRAIVLAHGFMLVLGSQPSSAQESLKGTPFSYGEDIPDRVADCKGLRDWASKAPKTHARITFVVRGTLSEVRGDSALVYLTMCAEPDLKVQCVTYNRNGMAAGDTVTFAGGYRQTDSGLIVLDPCLASRR